MAPGCRKTARALFLTYQNALMFLEVN